MRSARIKDYRIDDELSKRSNDRYRRAQTSRVIVTLVPGGKLPTDVKRYLRRVGPVETLDLINALVLDLPNRLVKQLAASPAVARIQYDRPIATHNYRTTVTVGSRRVQEYYGYNGAGVGVAVIDSGISSWHDDFTNTTAKLFPYGNQRVAKFVDFVNGHSLPYDDNGHGTHVSGIIAGNGQDSPNSEKQGVAPGASIIALKVLDQNGQGTISNIIAALGWIKTNAKTYNIRVVNMSVGAAIRESYRTDPLTLAEGEGKNSHQNTGVSVYVPKTSWRASTISPSLACTRAQTNRFGIRLRSSSAAVALSSASARSTGAPPRRARTAWTLPICLRSTAGSMRRSSSSASPPSR